MSTSRIPVILIVDDSDLIKHSLKSFFNNYDISIITCSDGLEGIQKSVEIKPHLIFLDLMMPNLDGLKMLKILKVIEDLKAIPVIVISGNTSKSNVLQAIESGADRVISKPLKQDVVLRNITELCGPDFLRPKPAGAYIANSDSEVMNDLKKIFLNSFPLKRQSLSEGLTSKSKEIIAGVIHDIKGAGGSIGFPILSTLCIDVEQAIKQTDTDWSYINSKCNQILSIVDNITVLN